MGYESTGRSTPIITGKFQGKLENLERREWHLYVVKRSRLLEGEKEVLPCWMLESFTFDKRIGTTKTRRPADVGSDLAITETIMTGTVTVTAIETADLAGEIAAVITTTTTITTVVDLATTGEATTETTDLAGIEVIIEGAITIITAMTTAMMTTTAVTEVTGMAATETDDSEADSEIEMGMEMGTGMGTGMVTTGMVTTETMTLTRQRTLPKQTLP